MKTVEQLGISPAPWNFAHDDGRSIVASLHGTPMIIYDFIDEKGIAKANARLIAAAPELYEALQDLLDQECDGSCSLHNENPNWCKEKCYLKKAVMALAKAGGAE